VGAEHAIACREDAIARHKFDQIPPKADSVRGFGQISSNMLAMSAIRATLDEILTEAAYTHRFALAERIEAALKSASARHGLAWCVTRVGARSEFQSTPTPARNGTEAGRQLDPELERQRNVT
jgi:glutamate-1-semialdehyde aminotransferase